MMDDSSQQDEKKTGEKRVRVGPVNALYRDVGPYLTLGIQLAAAIIFFFFLGSWVDKQYDTEPTFTLIGIALGTAGGFIKFFKTVMELNKKEASPKGTHGREG